MAFIVSIEEMIEHKKVSSTLAFLVEQVLYFLGSQKYFVNLSI